MYNEENDETILPKGIIPLRIVLKEDNGGGSYEYSEYFFNYRDGYLVTENGEDDLLFDYQNEQIVISMDLENDARPICQIEYILESGHENTSELNTYYLYHPVTESGSIIYYHNIEIEYNDENYLSFTILSLSGDAIDESDFISGLFVGENCIVISREVNDDDQLQH